MSETAETLDRIEQIQEEQRAERGEVANRRMRAGRGKSPQRLTVAAPAADFTLSIFPPAQTMEELPNGKYGQVTLRVRLAGEWHTYYECVRWDGHTREDYPAKTASVVDGRDKERS